MRKSSRLDHDLKKWRDDIHQALPPLGTDIPFFPRPVSQESQDRAHVQPQFWFLRWAGAGLVIAALMILLWSGQRTPTPTTQDSWVVDASRSDFLSLLSYYREVARLFQGHSVWILGDNASAELDIEESLNGTQIADVVLRLEIQRKSEDGSWAPLWHRDVLARENVWLDSSSPLKSDESVSVWIHGLSNGNWFVESHLELPVLEGGQTSRQVTLSTDATHSAEALTELGPGMRLVHRLMMLNPVHTGGNT